MPWRPLRSPWGNRRRACPMLKRRARCEGSMPPHYAGWIASELCADCVVAGQWQQAYTYALKAAATRDPTILSLGGAARWYEIAALLWGGSADQAREAVHRFGEGMNNNRRSAIPNLRSLEVLAQFIGEIDSAIARLHDAKHYGVAI